MIWVIIPAYNEELALPHTIKSVVSQSAPYRVIVVDGGSTDRTLEILHQEPQISCVTAPKGRALQMNAGARFVSQQQAAPNDWLLFLHADTQLPRDAFQYLHQLASDSATQAGGFRHRFSGKDWRLRMISWLDNLRCTHSHIIYGDQALFVRQGLFSQLGGFPSQPVLEDVAFGQVLLTQTTPRLLPLTVVTDSRKFVKMGVWRSFIRVLMIILHVEFGLPTFAPAFFRDVR
ncbi:MAG: TIGR04283 family arsenosugar biosynthesis glycosyltransferase [Nitrospira sp.]|nr:TIGR04283 family arsenosugar biosynthesis glycosyltransferase [Nitrospira sp.]HBP90270.1 glycosyl transferase [Nitrospiraceae bacterium]HNP30853.1 TIGR04283 family arsenosugar biosynthesis glycosyltransferase [Nitrospirales bacterium]